MGLLKVLTKEGRWTKHLPEGKRVKADLILSLRNYEQMQKDLRRGALQLSDPSVLAREMRLNSLAEAAGMGDTLPRIGGTFGVDPKTNKRFAKVNPRTGLTNVEELLGAGSPELRKFRPPRGTSFSGKFPQPPPPVGFRKFLGDLVARAKDLRNFAARNRRPLMYAGAGAGALGLGILGAHAATKKRHEELRGKG